MKSGHIVVTFSCIGRSCGRSVLGRGRAFIPTPVTVLGGGGWRKLPALWGRLLSRHAELSADQVADGAGQGPKPGVALGVVQGQRQTK